MIKSKKLIKFKNINHAFFNSIIGSSTSIYKSSNFGQETSDNKKNISRDLNIVSKKIGCKKNHLILLNQIHSNKIIHVKKIIKKKLTGDGLITDQKGIALGILTADCIPILIYDNKLKIIAAVHAGWKGIYRNIISNIIKLFLKNGSQTKHLYAAIGPCITVKSYEIQKDFKKKFIKKDKNSKFFFKKRKNKTYFSLNNYVYYQLKKLGIKNLDIINKNTFDPKNNFFSSRLSIHNKENDYGRNISIIMIK